MSCQRVHADHHPQTLSRAARLSDLERATQRLQRARPQAAALEHAIKTLVETIAKTGPRDAVDVTDAAGAGSETDGAAVADDRSKMARDQAVAELRGLVLHAHALTRGAQSALSSLVPPSPRTSKPATCSHSASWSVHLLTAPGAMSGWRSTSKRSA